MRISIHPEFHRALQAARQEEITRAARRRASGSDRGAWVVRVVRAVTAGITAGRLVFAHTAGAKAPRPPANLPDPVDI